MTTTRPAPAFPIASVRVAGGGVRDDLRAIRVVWKREIIRFSRSRIRILTSLVQPVLFLFVLGTGLSRVVPTSGSSSSVDFRTFMFPGILAMTVLFTAIFSAVSIVWDREFGFLREMLVAPVRRSALVIGKCVGGATVATIQGMLMIVLAGLVHVPYDPLLLLELVGMLVLTAFAITSFGVMLASRIAQVESFQMVMQFAVLPMFFLSGAVFPLSRLPTWLRLLTRIDPLSYAVAPMRHAVIAALPASGARELRQLDPGITWNGWHVPTYVEILVLAAFALVSLTVAAIQFNRTE
jgi:daunorubicin resistance ABC transporter membrane protein